MVKSSSVRDSFDEFQELENSTIFLNIFYKIIKNHFLETFSYFRRKFVKCTE